jgi:MFS family permease
MSRENASVGQLVVTDVPARLDRLPWARFHWLVVVALGITWILDRLEVTLSGSVAGALRDSPALRFSAADVGLANSAYLAGAVTGALFFGWLTDRLGRKRHYCWPARGCCSSTACSTQRRRHCAGASPSSSRQPRHPSPAPFPGRMNEPERRQPVVRRASS